MMRMSSQKGTISVQVLEQINKIDAASWDDCWGPDDYFTTAYLQALAHCGIDCTFRYFIALQSGYVIGASFGFMMRFPLSSLFQPKIFISGSPLNCGFPFGFVAPPPDQTVFSALVDAMIQEARAQHAALFALRDVSGAVQMNSIHHACLTLGLRHMPLYQNARMTVDWLTFEDYLTALRSRYREQVHRDLRSICQHQCRSLLLAGADALLYAPELQRLWFQAYQKHQDRDQLFLPLSYFREVLMLPNCRVFLVFQQEHLLAFVITFEHASVLEASHSGVDYALVGNIPAHRYAEYKIIRHAIDRHVSIIDFGLSHEANKRRLGCDLYGLSAYLRPISPLARLLAGLHIDRFLLRDYGFAIVEPDVQKNADNIIPSYVFHTK
jgi:predicted N-acyltransferase